MLSNLFGIAILVTGFAVILERVRMVAFTRKVISLGQSSMSALRDPTLSDDEKEQLMQANTLVMFRLLGILLAGMAAALLIPLLIVWALEQLGWLSVSEVLALLTRWDAVIVVSVLGVLIYWVMSKWRVRTS